MSDHGPLSHLETVMELALRARQADIVVRNLEADIEHLAASLVEKRAVAEAALVELQNSLRCDCAEWKQGL